MIWIQVALDHLAVQGLLALHTIMRSGELASGYRELAVVVFLLMTVVYQSVGVYRHETVRNDYISSLMQAWGTLVVLLAIYGSVTGTSPDFYGLVLTWTVTGLFAQLMIYFVISRLTRRLRRDTVNAVMVGNSDLARHICRHINRNLWVLDYVVGFVADEPGDLTTWDELGVPYLGAVDDIRAILAASEARRVYIAMPMEEGGRVKPLASALVDASVDVIWAPDIFSVSLLNHSVKEIAGVPLITFSETPLLGGSALSKAMLDKLGAAVALLLLSPIMLATAIAVKLTSPGPILFKQLRHGWDGRMVEIYKFRSMVVHQEAVGQVTQARRRDPRLTPVGGFIRSTSIDELPQLFNVLAGSMSLVGPRPHAVAHNELYRGQIQAYMLRHRIKPGLTGLAQVNGFRGETDSLEKMESRVSYDLAYINNWSIWLDIEILLRTVFVLFSRNAY